MVPGTGAHIANKAWGTHTTRDIGPGAPKAWGGGLYHYYTGVTG